MSGDRNKCPDNDNTASAPTKMPTAAMGVADTTEVAPVSGGGVHYETPEEDESFTNMGVTDWRSGINLLLKNL